MEPKQILIVDDDRLIRQILRLALQQENYQITEAANGAEALEVYRSATFDVVITDVDMPVMNGIELAQIIRSLSAPQSILFVTARADSLEMLTPLADDILLKPFALTSLRRITRELANHPSTLHFTPESDHAIPSLV